MPTTVRLLNRLHWLGHASFRLDGPPTIYIDPWQLKPGAPTADIVLVSHDHYDHCSPEDIRRISGPHTVVVASPPAAKKLGGHVRTVRPGERLHVFGVQIEAVPAYNVNKRFHPRQAEHVGFVVEVDGERIYFAGDTDRIPEMKDIRCDVALLPVGGTYTMDVAEAAQAAADIRPKVAIPMHYGTGGIGAPGDGERFRSLYAGEVVLLTSE